MQSEIQPPEFIQPVAEIPPAKNTIWGLWSTVGLGTAIFAIYFFIQNLVGLGFAIVLFFTNRNADPFQILSELGTNGLLVAIATLVSAAAGVGFIILFIKIRRGPGVAEYLGLKSISKRTYLLLLGVIVILLAVSYGFDLIADNSTNAAFMIEAYKTSVWPPLLWIAVVIFAPVFEEGFFRGFLLVGLKQSRMGSAGAIAITAVTFALLHFQYNLYGMAAILVMGTVFGIVRVRTGSLWSPIFLHSIWTLIGMIKTAAIASGIIS